MPRIAALDGLRGIAVLMVVVGHISGTAAPYAGNIGVTTFFVLSGYLITALLLKELQSTGRVDFRGFYLRRVARLYPALLVLLLAIPLVLAISGHRMSTFPVLAATAGLYLSDFALTMGVDLEYLNHTWSLAVEEQFYLVWPLVLTLIFSVLARRRGQNRLFSMTLALLSMALVWRVWTMLVMPPGYVYSSLDTNAFSLLLGCALATVPQGRVPRVPNWIVGLTIVGICMAAVMIRPSDDYMRNWVVLLAASASVLLVAGASQGAPLLAAAPLVFLGTVSYGLYLWHNVLLRVEWAGNEPSGWFRVLAAGASLLLAYLSLRLIELPIQRWIRSLTNRRPVQAIQP